MGYYWKTILYEGKIISELDEEKYKGKFIKIKDGYIFTKRKITMAKIDPILGKEEKEQGYLSYNELERWFNSSDYAKKLKEEWNSQENNTINEDVYIAQLGWSTYDNNLILEYNLPVKL